MVPGELFTKGSSFFRLLLERIKRTERSTLLGCGTWMDALVSGCAGVDAAGGRSGPATEESKVTDCLSCKRVHLHMFCVQMELM